MVVATLILARLVRQAFLSTAKKAGKSTFSGALSVLHLIGPESVARNAKTYCCAYSKAQAKQVFDPALEIAENTALMRQRIKPNRNYKTLTAKETNNVFGVIAAQERSLEGALTPFYIFDELSQFEDARPLNILENGHGTYVDPLGIIISKRYGVVGNPLEDRIQGSLNPIIRDDPAFYFQIHEMPEDADWKDRRYWKFPNPGIGQAPTWDDMDRAYKRALVSSVEANAFKQDRLQLRGVAEHGLVDPDKWDASAAAVGMDDVAGKEVWLGLDLGLTSDLTALALYCPSENIGLTWQWMPNERLEEWMSIDPQPWDVWLEEGEIFATPGSMVDMHTVAAFVSELSEKCRVVKLGYDGRFYDKFRVEAMEAKVELPPIEKIYQSAPRYAPLIRAFQEVLNEGGFRRPANPILENAAITVRGVADRKTGYLMPDKSKWNVRIDPIVALIMAVGIAAESESVEAVDWESAMSAL